MELIPVLYPNIIPQYNRFFFFLLGIQIKQLEYSCENNMHDSSDVRFTCNILLSIL